MTLQKRIFAISTLLKFILKANCSKMPMTKIHLQFKNTEDSPWLLVLKEEYEGQPFSHPPSDSVSESTKC